MPFNRKELHPDEREAFDTILDDALAASNDDDKAAALLAYDELMDCGELWVRTLQAQAFRAELQRACKDRAKSRSMVLVDYRGTPVSKTQRRAVKVRDNVTGLMGEQQTLIVAMTWDQFEQMRQRNRVARTALDVTDAMAAKIAALRDLYPDTRTVDEALHMHGMTLQEYLAA